MGHQVQSFEASLSVSHKKRQSPLRRVLHTIADLIAGTAVIGILVLAILYCLYAPVANTVLGL